MSLFSSFALALRVCDLPHTLSKFPIPITSTVCTHCQSGFTFGHLLVHLLRFPEASDAHVHRMEDHMFDVHVCVACRFVILLSDDRDYFFILYMVYVGVNMLLAGIALLHWPGSEQLELVNNPDGYQVSFCSWRLLFTVRIGLTIIYHHRCASHFG